MIPPRIAANDFTARRLSSLGALTDYTFQLMQALSLFDTLCSGMASIPARASAAIASELPKAGTVYTAELNRWDGVGPDRRLSVSVDSKLNWTQPTRRRASASWSS